MTLSRLWLLVAAVVALAAAPRAQSSVTVRLDPTIPVANLPVDVTVVFVDLAPSSVTAFFRTVGETLFQEAAAVDQGGGVWRVTLPFDAPLAGIEAYAQYVLDGETATEPELDPEGRPFRVPVFAFATPSDVSLAARQYRMVSVPLLLGDVPGLPISLGSAAPLAVFGDDFGATGDPGQWRLLRWDAANEVYLDAVAQPDAFGLVAPGDGYWLISGTSGAFDVDEGLSAGVAFDDDTPFAAPVAVRLESGWNQIGSPFFVPVVWDNVDRPLTVEDPVAFEGAYVGGQTTLDPWHGYFVFNAGAPTVLQLRAGPQRNPVKTAAPLADRMRERAGPGAATLRVAATLGEARDEVYLGLADARVRSAPIDLRKPPAVDGGLRVAVEHQGDWIGRFQPHGGAEWTVALHLPDSDAVTLSLTEFGDWPDGLIVYDLDRDQRLAVVGGRVVVPADGRVRRLRLSTSPTASAPALALAAAAPNPSRGAVAVSFTLATAGRARLDVVDVTGRIVRSIQDARLPAGPHDAEWDGLDASGQPVAAGVYLLRLRSASGTAATRVTRLR